MVIKYKFDKSGNYEYYYLYELLKNNFHFNEIKYGDYVKDVIKILIIEEANGNPIINLDDQTISFQLLKKGWPDKHLNALNKTGLINNNHSPIVINNRQISWLKWTKKLERISESLLIKKMIENNKIIKTQSNKNSNQKNIHEIFNYSNLVLLQGGPGTGKSSLIIKTILNFLDSDSELNIGLSAPTGKAVARLKESINFHKHKVNIKKLDQIECQTLHSWIYNFRNKSCKLKYKLNELDFFIIDEMSMVNIDLVESILGKISSNCKILLVGDANQLPPINSCSIWNHIFTKSDKLFESCTINLTKSYRNRGEIESLSKRIFNQSEESKNKINVLDNSIKDQSNLKVFWVNQRKIPKEITLEINTFLDLLKKSTSELSKKDYIFETHIDNLIDVEKELISTIFENLNSNMFLCEKNIGTWGVKEINKIFINQKEPYNFSTLDEGLPIMCTENNNELGISNGDIGLLIGTKEKRRFLFRKFNKNNEPIVSLIDPEKLESVIPAIAITIHKAQGSESKKVTILWTNKNINSKTNTGTKEDTNQIIFTDNYQKRLFYTGITRAKERLNLYVMK